MRRASTDLSDPARNIEESIGAPGSHAVDATMDDLVTASDDEHNPRVFTPPPHIAARFYRPSQIRRKDSAASSRRNSISSSRSSIGFSHEDGLQSKYIAQQLRRASILEDRKARLADRAAHAEKVRLRAAMTKAAHQKTSNAEERTLAAAQAREKNLAEIVATCAEEVKRAKSRAEAIKDLREQQLRQLRQQMEQRLAEAEKRRENLRKSQAARRARGSSLGAKKPGVELLADVKEQDLVPLNEDTAVSRIQWWWRANRRQKAVREFSKLGLNIDGVRDTSFESVVELLAQEDVLMTTASALRVCGLKEGEEAGCVADMAAVRTFLSAFMILGHPNHVLSNNDSNEQKQRAHQSSSQGQYLPKDASANPQLQDLVAKARDLLITFENILSRLTRLNCYTPPPALQEALPEAYATFHNAFIAWKARDSDALIDIMLMQFVELDAIMETVKEMTEESVTETYRESIQDNQIKLMVRIKKLAGPQRGKKLVFEAVQKARKARAAKKTTGDRRPRVAEGSDIAADISKHATAAEVVSSQLRTLTPPPTPPNKQVSRQAIDYQAYPPILPENRVIVHELAINREYRIEYEYFREQHKLRMDPLLKDLKASEHDEEKEFQYLIIMIHYIKDRLQNLVRPGNSMHTFIGEILDIDVAQRQFRAGSFSYDKFFSSMGLLLPKLCAPVRDEQVKDFVENKMRDGHVVDRLEALVAIIDVMLYDYANYMLQVATPKLTEHAASYETKRFAEDLESGIVTLDSAEASWRAAYHKVHTEAAKRDPEGINHPKSRPTSDKIYWQMLLDEFTQPSPRVHTIPAPLALDSKRRTRLGLQTLRIATAGAILLQCKNVLKRDVRAPWRAESARIFTVLEAATDSTRGLGASAAVDGVMAALESGRAMPAATKTHLRALVLKVITASLDAKDNNSEPQEPVLRLLLTRVRGHMLARLQANSASDKIRATSTAGEKLAGLGLPEFVDKVRDVVDEIVRVGTVDKEAHGSIWEAIASTVTESASSAPASTSA